MKYLLTAAILFSATLATAEELPLPTDEGKWYFTIAGDIDYAITGDIVDSLKRQTHYRHIPANDPIYARYEKYIGPTPSVFIQRADGRVVYKIGGADFPKSAAELNKALKKCRPKPPPPVPLPAPEPKPEPVPVPDTVVPDTDVPNDELNLLYLALAALGGAGGRYFQARGQQ